MNPLRNYTFSGVKMNGLKSTDSFLLNNYPVAKKRSPGVNCDLYKIYDDTGVDILSTSINTGIGKTGVYLPLYKKKWYNKQSDEENYYICKYGKQKFQ